MNGNKVKCRSITDDKTTAEHIMIMNSHEINIRIIGRSQRGEYTGQVDSL